MIRDLKGFTRKAPWGDDFDIRLKAIECELESDLVVSFTCAAVRDVAIGVVNEDNSVNAFILQAYSHCSRSATAIMPRAMTGRASEVPRR